MSFQTPSSDYVLTQVERACWPQQRRSLNKSRKSCFCAHLISQGSCVVRAASEANCHRLSASSPTLYRKSSSRRGTQQVPRPESATYSATTQDLDRAVPAGILSAIRYFATGTGGGGGGGREAEGSVQGQHDGVERGSFAQAASEERWCRCERIASG